MKFVEVKFLILFNAYCLIFSLTIFMILRVISLNKEMTDIYTPGFRFESPENLTGSIYDGIAQRDIKNLENLTWKVYLDIEFVVNGLINYFYSKKFQML